MYTALYRAYRPEVFEQLLGQEHIIRILKNQIASGTTSHAYLFCGTRGTGKTTTARLLAKGLNCLSEGERPCGQCAACQAIREGSFLDVMEIDAASNRGIDDIRQLRDSVNYPPAVGRHKVYIIDEVHMLSTEAFNALLKTLEEPPEYVTFILATTEPRKLPATILSRCLRLDFKRVPETVLIQGMRDICGQIGIQVTDSALRIIAANADGSVRDGLSILDQCISGGDRLVDAPDVLDFLGASGEEVFLQLTDFVTKGRTAEALEYLDGVLADGKDVRQLIRDWIGHYRNLMMTKFIRDPRSVINLSVENIDRIREQSSLMELDDINRGILELSKTADQARFSSQPRILLEVCIVKLAQGGGAFPARTASEPLRSRRAPVTADRPAAGRPQQLPQGQGASAQQEAPRPKAQEPWEPPVTQAPKPNLPTSMRQDVNEPAPMRQDGEEDFSEASPGALDALIAAAEKEKNEAAPQAPPEEASPKAAGAEDFAAEADTSWPEPPQTSRPEETAQPSRRKQTAEAAPSAAGGTQKAEGAQDLVALWDAVFQDGAQEKGSFYLIRSNSMLTGMDEHTFTVTVRNDLTRRQVLRSRQLLEDLMQARTGAYRSLQIVTDEDGGDISAEEAAARASDVLGVHVELE